MGFCPSSSSLRSFVFNNLNSAVEAMLFHRRIFSNSVCRSCHNTWFDELKDLLIINRRCRERYFAKQNKKQNKCHSSVADYIFVLDSSFDHFFFNHNWKLVIIILISLFYGGRFYCCQSMFIAL